MIIPTECKLCGVELKYGGNVRREKEFGKIGTEKQSQES